MNTLYEYVVKELGYGMNIPSETDIAFVAMWVSKRANGSLTSTITTHYLDDDSLTDEVRQKIADVLRSLSERVSSERSI